MYLSGAPHISESGSVPSHGAYNVPTGNVSSNSPLFLTDMQERHLPRDTVEICFAWDSPPCHAYAVCTQCCVMCAAFSMHVVMAFNLLFETPPCKTPHCIRVMPGLRLGEGHYPSNGNTTCCPGNTRGCSVTLMTKDLAVHVLCRH